MAKTIAFIGVGQISDAHLDGLRHYNQGAPEPLKLTAVVDTFPGRANEWCGRHFKDKAAEEKPVVLKDYRELLKGKRRPDMVSLLLPHHLHLDVGREFLEAGIAIQMQKPIGLAIRDSAQLIEIAKRTGTALVVSEPSVLGRGNRMTIEWLKSRKELGDPTLVIDQAVIDLKGGFFMTPWRHLKGMAGAGWFIDHGVHRTHWMLEAFGPCRTASARTRQIEPSRENDRWGKVEVDTEDLAAAVLEFENGPIVQWTVMSGGRGQGHGMVSVWGTKGSYRDGKFTPSGSKEPQEPDFNAVDPGEGVPEHSFAHSYAELVQAMSGRTNGLIGLPERALEAEAIVYACLESAHTGETVGVADIVSGKRHAYEDSVWQARERIRSLDMNSLT